MYKNELERVALRLGNIGSDAWTWITSPIYVENKYHTDYIFMLAKDIFKMDIVVKLRFMRKIGVIGLFQVNECKFIKLFNITKMKSIYTPFYHYVYLY